MRILRLLTVSLAGFLAFSPGVHAGPIKASVEEPVLEDLMGGCSLKCGFGWQVEALPSAKGKAQTVRTLNDESAETAWIAEPNPDGTFPRLRIAFPKKLPKEVEGETPFYGIDLINGHWKTEALWEQHGRVKRLKVFYNDRLLRDILLGDSRRWQRVEFPDIMVRSGDFMTFEIVEIYPGTKPGAALSEIVLQGAH